MENINPTILICTTNNEISELKEYYSSFNKSETLNLTFNFSEGKYYKVMLEKEIIGFASIVEEKYSFIDLKRFIHPNYRNRKIGGLLLDFIIHDAKNLNKKRLTGSFLGSNNSAATFFESKGFKVTGGNDISFVVLALNKEDRD